MKWGGANEDVRCFFRAFLIYKFFVLKREAEHIHDVYFYFEYIQINNMWKEVQNKISCLVNIY